MSVAASRQWTTGVHQQDARSDTANTGLYVSHLKANSPRPSFMAPPNMCFCTPTIRELIGSHDRTANDINTCQRAGEAITGKAFDDFSLSRVTGSKTYQPQDTGKCVRLLQSFGNVWHIIASSICRPWSCGTFVMDAAQEYLKAQLLPQE
ncbi:unnamed protein product, partial [Symbiodinium necroappetens]